MNIRLFLLSALLATGLGICAQTSTNIEYVDSLVSMIRQSVSGEGICTQLNKLLATYEQRYTRENHQYADCMQWCAYVCAEFGDNLQATRLLRESSQLFRQHGRGPFEGRDTVSHIFMLDLRSKIESGCGRDYMAVRHARRATRLKEQYFGRQSEPYLNALLDLSRLYAERLCYGKSNRSHNQGFAAYVERIKQEFCQVSESQRTIYWNTAMRYINKTISVAHKAARRSHRGGDKSLASAAYNAMLLSKGLLLNTTRGFEEFVSQNGNAVAVANMQLKKTLASQQTSQHVLDSLDYVIIHALQQQGQQFRLPHLDITWHDVADHLQSEDLAVEFYHTPEGEYGALLLKKGWHSPRMVRLPAFAANGKTYLPLADALATSSLENYTPQQADGLWQLSRSIWTDDIVRHFPQHGQGRVFFAADGLLLTSGIEHLPFVKPGADGTLQTIGQLFPMYRMSSTRFLAMSHQSASHLDSSVAIYGGLEYSMYSDDMVADWNQYHSDHVPLMVFADKVTHSRAARGADEAIPFLSGTKTEADSIAATIGHVSGSPTAITIYEGEKGTEASFKALSGSSIGVLHLATHGFFYSAADTTFNHFKLGNNPMARSGLFFAGADNKWLGDSIPQGVDDGFLTALEIASLDFSGLDMVTLSACETAKGDVAADGVFGLQRGFKMAGAHSILMSLWKVDDVATCLLMTEFYRHWMNGNSKYDALLAAQQAVRSHPGWEHPRFWAAFVLLDGMD